METVFATAAAVRLTLPASEILAFSVAVVLALMACQLSMLLVNPLASTERLLPMAAAVPLMLPTPLAVRFKLANGSMKSTSCVLRRISAALNCGHSSGVKGQGLLPWECTLAVLPTAAAVRRTEALRGERLLVRVRGRHERTRRRGAIRRAPL